MNKKQSIVCLYPSLDALAEVLNKTGNPEIASQLLCGTYEQPKLNVCNVTKNYHFVSYDKWDNKVTYSKPRIKHYKSEEDMATETNGSSYKENDRPFSKAHSIERETGTMSYHEWMDR